MYTKEFDNKIDKAVVIGKISSDARKDLHIESKPMQIDSDELDIVIDGKAYIALHGDNKIDDTEFDLPKIDKEDVYEEESSENDFSLKRLWELIRYNKTARWIFIGVLIVLLWPIISFVLLLVFGGLFSTCGSNQSSSILSEEVKQKVEKVEKTTAEETPKTSASNDVKLEDAVKNTSNNITSADDVIVIDLGEQYGKQYNKISAIGKILYATVIAEEDGSELGEKEMKFENTIKEFCCIGSTVYVVVDMLEPGDVSKLPFVGLYKVNVAKQKWEFMETSNYITFNKAAKKAHLKTADGLAGETEAEGYLWQERDINL